MNPYRPYPARSRRPFRPLDSLVIKAARVAVEHRFSRSLPECRVVAATRQQLAWLAFDGLGPRRPSADQRDAYLRSQYTWSADAAAVFLPGLSEATIVVLSDQVRGYLKYEQPEDLTGEMWQLLVHEYVHLAQSMRPGYREEWLRIELHNLGQKSHILPRARVARWNQVIEQDEAEADAVEEELGSAGVTVYHWLLADLIREVAR